VAVVHFEIMSRNLPGSTEDKPKCLTRNTTHALRVSFEPDTFLIHTKGPSCELSDLLVE